MFIYDKPIESVSEDFLSRTKFSQHLGKALTEWKEKESLVIAIYGEWGSGKSSVINLATEFIASTKNHENLTIIKFNPWSFSEEKNLTYHFFNEIAKELEITLNSPKDKIIAEKLKLYARLLSLAPKREVVNDISSQILKGLGLTGISLSQLLQWFDILGDWAKYSILGIGLLLIIIALIKDILLGLSDYFLQKHSMSQKSATEIKNEIVKELSDREKKIVIVIDDIDRLNQSEIRQIFRLIRINADFPNTIYLLAFDRNIVEQNLEEQAGVSGKNYLDKIVQVQFNLPMAHRSKISIFLFDELARILTKLPPSARTFFELDNSYWSNIYNLGLKDFFKNLRDVKRFANSLEFNLSQMYQGESMEVNPIDFIAIEGIRIFVPEFYIFMQSRNKLFTSIDSEREQSFSNPRKNEIENELKELSVDQKESILRLLKILFPQVGSIYQFGYTTTGYEYQSEWSRNLRVCSSKHFDSYFNLIPGGEEDALSQFEIDAILSKSNSVEDFEIILNKYIESKKLRMVIQRIQDFTVDQIRIPQNNVKNLIQVIFNISDNLPDDLIDERLGIFDLGLETEMMQLIYQLLKREPDKNKNFEILKDTITHSKSLFGPIEKISLELATKKEGERYAELVVSEDRIEDLKKLCVEKIKMTNFDILLKNNKLPFILHTWKHWNDKDDWRKFILWIKEDENKLLEFSGKFITQSRSYTLGGGEMRIIEKFDYTECSEFIDIEEVITILEKIKTENSEQYQKNKKVVDLFLKDFNKKDQATFG